MAPDGQSGAPQQPRQQRPVAPPPAPGYYGSDSGYSPAIPATRLPNVPPATPGRRCPYQASELPTAAPPAAQQTPQAPPANAAASLDYRRESAGPTFPRAG